MATFDPKSERPFRISRTKIEQFIRCSLCFYLNQRCGVTIPDGPPFGLNIRIDQLLKKEFEHSRKTQQPHTRAKKLGIHAVSFDHPEMIHWLNVYKDVGLENLHNETNLIVFGAPDDIWLVNNSELSVVDGKATHSNKSMRESTFWEEYKRQVDLYSWLLSHQGLYYPVSKTSYFIRFNTNKLQENFEDNRLEFAEEIVVHAGSYDWIEPTLTALKACLIQDDFPAANPNCSYCRYRVVAALAQTKNRA